MTPHRRIALTGASGGIGLALSARLAGPGVSMLLIARDPARLAAAAAAAAGAGAQVETARADVTDRAALADALLRFDAAAPIDLLIANAGVSAGLGPDRAPERPEDSERLWRVNYGGMLNTVEPLLPALRDRPGAQIALMSSIAALRPLPDMPSYSASKAAVRAYGISLRGWLRPRGVAVSVICPGFVTSPMSQRHRGFKPFEISAERAAEIVARGLERRRAFITFPWPLAALAWLDQRLPPALSDWFGKGFAARIEPEDR
ncbi:MAG: SDR family NAD(P)-dependent oxidoreductase [Rubrimonas sp.]|uniref:SDR family NAD(P)-dependent oxidoreductase n=1 Tax=Rubrimonas sp. TaxID=2036015 RepID=UPI002FDCC80C